MVNKAKVGTAGELAAIFPVAEKVSVRIKRATGEGEAPTVTWEQRTVSVEEMAIEQFGRVAAELGPIIDSLVRSPNFLALAIQHPEPIMAAVAQAIDWPVEDVRLMHGADFVTLVRRVLEDNTDFFRRLLGPDVFAMLATMREAPDVGVV